MKRGAPLARGKGLSRGKGLARRSAKRVDDDEAWFAVRGYVLMRDKYECQAEPLWGSKCSGRLDVHHLRPVGAGGARLESSNAVVCCRHHHEEIHNGDPRRARELGLLR